MDELKGILLLTIRDYEFECAGLKPNNVPKATYTKLDMTFGDVIFQELAMEARPRGHVPMTVKRRGA